VNLRTLQPRIVNLEIGFMRRCLAILAVWLLSSLVPPAAQAEVVIGIANPLSGPYVASGARNLLAVMTAVEHVNARGGVLGEPLRLAVADDECGLEEAVTAAETLVRAGVVMVVGHMCSHSSLLAAAIYDISDIVMITPSSTHPRVTGENRPNVFRLIGHDDQQAEAAAALIASRWPGRRLAIAHDDSVYGRGLALATRRALHRRDRRVALFLDYEPHRADYAGLARELATAGIELLYLAGYGPDAGRIAAAAREAGLSLQLIGGDGLGMDEFAVTAAAAAEGVIFSTFGAVAGDRAAASDLTGQQRAVLRDFAAGGLGAYAAVEVWAEAVSRAGGLDLKRVVYVLERGRFNAVTGRVAFDDKGDLVDAVWSWRVWRRGKAVPLR